MNSSRGLHFLGNLLPAESGIHQVQAAPGFAWKPVTSVVDYPACRRRRSWNLERYDLSTHHELRPEDFGDGL